MAISAGDATTIAGYVIAHGGIVAGGSDTITVATWIRNHWGGTGTDAQVIALYGEATADTDLVRWALRIRRSGDGRA